MYSLIPKAYAASGGELDPKSFNDSDLLLAAALAGQGLAYLFEDQVTKHVAEQRSVRVLDAWCAPFPP
jgi:DNA-binding transcriptional LysR family regulator